MAELHRFVIREMVGEQVAIQAAVNYRALRALGITVRKTIDLLIGTFCIENGLPLLHADRDFEPMERHSGWSRWRFSVLRHAISVAEYPRRTVSSPKRRGNGR